MSALRTLTRASVTVLILLAAACNSPAPVPPPAVQQADPVELARQAFNRQDWAAAAPLLRTALEAQPQHFEMHYKLAVAASYLSLNDEATREFEWVLANAREGSEEARIARQWLASVARGESARREESGEEGPSARKGSSGISGVVSWAEPGARPEPKRRMQVHLIALPGQKGVEEQRFTIRTDQEGHYAFSNVPPGNYKVTNTVAGPPTWRLRVTLQPGQTATLNLDNSNSLSARDDFPGG